MVNACDDAHHGSIEPPNTGTHMESLAPGEENEVPTNGHDPADWLARNRRNCYRRDGRRAYYKFGDDWNRNNDTAALRELMNDYNDVNMRTEIQDGKTFISTEDFVTSHASKMFFCIVAACASFWQKIYH